MNLVEKHIIKPNNKYYKKIDEVAFKSKNLYNYANYWVRQCFIITSKIKEGKEITLEEQEKIDYINKIINEKNEINKSKVKKGKDGKLKPIALIKEISTDNKYINFYSLDKILQNSNEYKALYSINAQQVLKILDKNWKSFFESIKDWNKNPHKYLGRPKLPTYKDKDFGRNIIVFTGLKANEDGFIKFPKKNFIKGFTIKTNLKKFTDIRIVKKNLNYVVEIIYEQQEENNNLNKDNIISIDLGVNNLATITNNINLQPIIINGKPLKSMNQYYNKEKAKYMSYIGGKGISRNTQRLDTKRNNKINDYLHKASKKIIDYCLENNIGTIVIGKNTNWKQECNIGKKNNQNFVQIPHSTFIQMITYKAQLKGIDIKLNEESYSSKASFLDLDEIPTYKKNKEGEEKIKYKFSGTRIHRGLYKSKNGKLINADVNGSYNIMRKTYPDLIHNNNINYYNIQPVVINI